MREAAAKHGVSNSTLLRRTKSIIARPVGRPADFSEYDEFVLATLLRGFNCFHTPLTPEVFHETCAVLKRKRGESSRD